MSICKTIHPTSITLLILASLFVTVSSHAQYVWVDEKGVKQFSDLPPPNSVQNNKILKTPSRSAPTYAKEPSVEPTVDSPVNEKLRKPETVASRNEDFMKRKLEQEEKSKKAEAEKQALSDKTKHCEQARSYQQSLASGVRIGNTDKNGERSFISDEERARELNDVNKKLNNCK
jgi:hypothetical protein